MKTECRSGKRRCSVGVDLNGEPIFEQFVRLAWHKAQLARVVNAAQDLVWFDWSDNDSDAVAAIDKLRKVLAEMGEA